MRTLQIIATFTMFLAVGCKTTLVDKGVPKDGDPEVADKFRRSTSAKGTKPVGKWWKAFNDDELTELVAKVEAHNPDAKAALARVDQAYAAMGISRSARLPTVNAEALAFQQRDSKNNLLFPINDVEYSKYRVAVNASWEIDLWGKLRGAYQRDKLTADATKADYEAILLSLQATMARQYFALRYVESDAAILANAIVIREKALKLQQSRVRNGAGIIADESKALAELETTRTQAQGLERTRGKLEHSIAILAGEDPSALIPGRGQTPNKLPVIPAGIPVELLSRRPDLRSAEANLRSTAQQVGIRKTEFLPTLSLSGTGGVASLNRDLLFGDGNSSLYNFGPQLDIPIYQGGLLVSAVKRAKSTWRESVENYRSTLLTAVGEVDDSLLDLQILEKQIKTQRLAVEAGKETFRAANLRYEKGLVSYIEVVDADRVLLQARRIYNGLRGEQTAATVQLIQALGGQW